MRKNWILNMKWFLLLLLIPEFAFGQKKHDDSLRSYFRNPVGLPMELVANFGELRPDHWHMGLDIRTKQKENQPIYAAADGFISHVGIRPQSFGRFIIIDHPNGLSTLYAHLNNFFAGLEEYVTAQQYEKESWAVELDLQKSSFRFARATLYLIVVTPAAHKGHTCILKFLIPKLPNGLILCYLIFRCRIIPRHY
ncbi:MAG: M23 family metallopeptidase [Chitinophagaceae bacterium]|nr:M23 family metallopeptidase [Chitinophagaceae bacterium]